MARILVADDDPDIRMLIEMRLAKEGHEITAVADGAAAWSELSAGGFAVAILDNSMPALTGLQVIAKVRQEPALAALKVLMVTAFAQATDVQQGLDAGADEYLTKPFTLQSLCDHVTALLG